MHVIVELCVIPLGIGLSVSKYVAACHRVIEDAGLTQHLDPDGTNIEGEWDAVFAAVKAGDGTETIWPADKALWPEALAKAWEAAKTQ